MNVRKLVYLCVSLVLLVVSFVLCVDGEKTVTAQYDLEKAESITDISQLSDIVNALPSSNAYYGSTAGDGEEEDGQDIISDNFKSLTYVEEGSISQRQYGTITELDRKMTIYFTEEGAYYQAIGVQTKAKEFNVEFENSNLYDLYENRSILTFDFELYVTSGKVFMKYNKWDTTTEVWLMKANCSTLNDSFDWVGKLDPDLTEEANKEVNKVEEALQETIDANLGKWIDLSVTEELPEVSEEDAANMSKDELMDYMKVWLAAEASNLLISTYLTMNDSNVSTLLYLMQYVTTNLPLFTKHGELEVYSLKTQNSSNGYENEDEDEEQLPAFMEYCYGNFNVNLIDPKAPKLYLDVTSSIPNVSSSDYQLVVKCTMTFKNINSTSVSVLDKAEVEFSDFISHYLEVALEAMTQEEEE